MKHQIANKIKTYTILLGLVMCSLFQYAYAQAPACNPSGNVIIFTNYDGGELNINVDQNIPNLKIGVCTYEPVRITISGPFSSNVAQVMYAGFNSTQNNNNCNIGNFPTSIVGVPPANQVIQTIPPVTLNNPNGYNFGIICAYSCNTGSNQGGCNTVDQIEDYFMTQFGGALYSLNAQYCCWLNSNTYSVAALAGQCCAPASGSATLSYTGQPFCTSITQPQSVTINTSSYGTFSATPAGLSIDPMTGDVVPSASLPGTYTVTYTMPGCPTTTASTTLQITNSPTATIAYAGPYAVSNTSPQSVVFTGSTGGTYTSSPAGLSINPATGAVTPSLSLPGTYTVTYTIPANPPCQAFATTATVVITGASNVCNPNGNVMIYSNYDGGILNINVDQNIPNLKIGICSYEAVQVNITGPFVGNITEVIYAGFDGSNNNCNTGILTTVINGVSPSIVTIYSNTNNNIAPTTHLGDPLAPGFPPVVNCMVGTSGCVSNTTGGGNSSEQVVQFFLAEFGAGASLFAHVTQYACFSGTYQVSAGGNCCLQTPTTPPNPIYAGNGTYNFILPEDTLLCGSSITIDLSAYPVLTQPPTYPGYIWSDGTVGPIINITQPGTYSFTVGDYCHYGSNLLTDTIVVLPCCVQPPAPTVSANVTYCTGDIINPISATPQNGGSITWYSDAGLNNVLATGSTFTPTLNAGVNNFYVTETNNGCQGPASAITLTLNPLQSAALSYTGNQFCQTGTNPAATITGTQGGTFTSFPAGLTFAGAQGTINLIASAVGNYSVVYTSPGPCASADTFQITITPALNGNFSYSSNTYCRGGTNPSAIAAPGAILGTFSATPNTLVFSNAATGTIDLTSSPAGSYAITNTIPASGGCPAFTASFGLNIIDVPSAIIDYDDTPYCSGTNLVLTPNLTGSIGGDFTVTPPGISYDALNGNIDLQNSFPGNYTVTYTIAPFSGCPQFQTTDVVQVLPGAQVQISPSVTINQFETGTLFATGTGNFLWSNGETTDSINVAPKVTTEYCVTADLNGCKDSACAMIYLDIECGDIFVPSAFSPNDDQSNDMLCLRGNCVESMYFSVYDRWGNLVFESYNQEQCWDGTFKGKPCNSGVYVFRVEVTAITKEFYSAQGNITLVR
ncbi:MAG: gliding motility-associated C-terminal domain-containing protein [Bacteroidota bacterium]